MHTNCITSAARPRYKYSYTKKVIQDRAGGREPPHAFTLQPLKRSRVYGYTVDTADMFARFGQSVDELNEDQTKRPSTLITAVGSERDDGPLRPLARTLELKVRALQSETSPATDPVPKRRYWFQPYLRFYEVLACPQPCPRGHQNVLSTVHVTQFTLFVS
ncbi:hypothetical protein EVAR_4823_1 [Eumeta japonica]|uniref:Uncharacterized protein n=1 Tax=Eumeta variegata TaxID=151549 RepID=A0A4C1T1V7_EUMVA|nr:hypothetical protein EVAR_4823_1 [Eumeta japonica]